VGTDEIVPAQDPTTALAVIDQRQVALLEADEILAVRAGDDEIYVPLRGLCANLGIAPTGQVRRIRADEALAEGLREVRIRTAARGLQTMQCLRIDTVPYWLSGIEPGRVRPDLRAKLMVYKRWVRQLVRLPFQKNSFSPLWISLS